jgi:hypothetical protein
MTRIQLAQKIKQSLESNLGHEGLPPTVYSSSSYGVCKEVLGECTPEELQHTESRSGVGFMIFLNLYPEDIQKNIEQYSSLRDILNALPP